MKVLELFAGSRSIGKAAEELGHQVFSVDINAFHNINLVQDIEFLDRSQIPFIPDIIWASPPCTTYSIAAISTHRDGIVPKSEFAIKSDRLLDKVIEIVSWFPESKSFIENPRGMMRKMPPMKKLDRVTVWYCKYGDTRAKPTDIWTNHLYSIFNPEGWKPRPQCFNGNTKCHHEEAPRGSRTGTQGLKNDYERSKIPYELCIEILKSCEAKKVQSL